MKYDNDYSHNFQKNVEKKKIKRMHSKQVAQVTL